MKEDLVFPEFDGTGAIAVTLTRNQPFRIKRLELHLNTAPTTSEDLTVTRDAKKSTRYDVNYYKRDLSVGSVVDLVIPYGEGYEFPANEEIDIAYTNTDGVTWGLRAVLELL